MPKVKRKSAKRGAAGNSSKKFKPSPPKTFKQRAERIGKVLGIIEARQDSWDQIEWHCGTSHCFGGFAQLLSRGLPLTKACPLKLTERAEAEARVWLGLSEDEACDLFAGCNQIQDIRRICKKLCKPRAEKDVIMERVGDALEHLS